MKALDPGHQYLLNTYDGSYEQRLQFMKREGPGYPGNVGHYSGTNCQEAIRVLIDRVKYLDGQIPCVENRAIIENLRHALFLFELRAADRHNRAFPVLDLPIELEPTCLTCGHLVQVCAGHP